MKISNIRIEKKDERAFLCCDVHCGFSKSNTLWFAVSNDYTDWLTDDSYDAFLVAALWPCMCYGEDIIIEGNVTLKLYKNITNYIIPLIKQLRPDYHLINIEVNNFEPAQKGNMEIVGTGFSGGVDSFSTIIDHFYEEDFDAYKLNTLFFFNLGQYGNINNPQTKKNTELILGRSLNIANEIGLPLVYTDSNLFEFYKPHWEYDAGPLCRISAILVFQKVCRKYYVSGSYNYFQMRDFKKYEHLDDVADNFIYSLLSPPNTEIIIDGSQYFRHEKVKKIAEYPISYKNLYVCISNIPLNNKGKNCTKCSKCARTLLELEVLNKLHLFSEAFDLNLYHKKSFELKCYVVLNLGNETYNKEIVNLFHANNKKLPSKIIAWLYLFPQRFKNKFF